MKYPSCYLVGEGAHGEILSIAYAGDGQHQDTGGKVVHVAPNTTSQIMSKSISKGTGRASYRGLCKVHDGATGAKSNVECDALRVAIHRCGDDVAVDDARAPLLLDRHAQRRAHRRTEFDHHRLRPEARIQPPRDRRDDQREHDLPAPLHLGFHRFTPESSIPR